MKKLSEADEAEIRRLYGSGGWTYEALAAQYGTSTTPIFFAMNPEARCHKRALLRAYMRRRRAESAYAEAERVKARLRYWMRYGERSASGAHGI